jgi:hypothetical protein
MNDYDILDLIGKVRTLAQLEPHEYEELTFLYDKLHAVCFTEDGRPPIGPTCPKQTWTVGLNRAEIWITQPNTKGGQCVFSADKKMFERGPWLERFESMIDSRWDAYYTRGEF